MKVVEYSDKYLLSSVDMFYNYFKEIHGSKLKGNKVTVEGMIRQVLAEKSVYLLLNNNKPIGFMVGFLNSEYGMVEEHIVCDYQYIKPKYRNGVAIAYLTHALAEICVRLGYGIVNTTINTSSSTHNVLKLGAEIHSTTSIITNEQATKIYNKLKTRIER